LKKIAILGTVVVLLGCSTATVADGHKASLTTKYEATFAPNTIDGIFENIHYQTMLERQAQQALEAKIRAAETQRSLLKNEQAILDKVSELRTYVGKTWYVFSGSSPRGWDCSGLTTWFYSELGVELDHSASKQGHHAGRHVDAPKIGDIVAFSHLSSTKYYHVGIYIGNNKIIHAGFKPGRRTEAISLDDASFKNSEISFVRVIEN
jgi:cell wall-associated NlpC family hydrolase